MPRWRTSSTIEIFREVCATVLSNSISRIRFASVTSFAMSNVRRNAAPFSTDRQKQRPATRRRLAIQDRKCPRVNEALLPQSVLAFPGGAPPGVSAAPAPIIGISGEGWGAFLRSFDTMWKHLPLKEMAYGIGRSPENARHRAPLPSRR